MWYCFNAVHTKSFAGIKRTRHISVARRRLFSFIVKRGADKNNSQERWFCHNACGRRRKIKSLCAFMQRNELGAWQIRQLDVPLAAFASMTNVGW